MSRYAFRGYYIHMPANPGCNCEECDNTFQAHNSYGGGDVCRCDGCKAQRNRRHFQSQNLINKVVGGDKRVSTVNFCDRCQSMGKSDAMGTISMQASPEAQPDHFEICPGCVQDFMDWKTGDIITDRERAYKQPWRPEDKKDDTGEVVTTKNLRKLLRELEAGDGE